MADAAAGAPAHRGHRPQAGVGTSRGSASQVARRGRALRTLNKRTRTRVQVDLSADMYKELERLAQETGAGSVNDFARAGLRFYRWYLQHKAQGYQLMIEKDGKPAAIAVLL